MDRDRLLQLVNGYVDGELTDRERAELSRLVVTSPDARRTFWSAVHQHVQIGQLLDEERGRAMASADSPADWVSTGGPARHSTQDAPRRRARVVGVAAAVGLLLGGAINFVLLLLGRPVTTGPTAVRPLPNEPPATATATGPAVVEQCAGEVWAVSLPRRVRAAAGMAVNPDDEIRTEDADARVTLRYPDGTRLTFGPYSSARVSPESDGRSGKRVFLAAGSLDAEVAPQPPGRAMRVGTPQAEVEVLGTAFRQSCAPSATCLALDSGSVRVVRVSDRSALDLTAGEYVVVSAEADPLRRTAPPVRRADPSPALRKVLVRAATLDPRGRFLAVADENEAVVVRDLATGRVLRDVGTATRNATALAVSPDGAVLAVGRKDGRVLRFDTGTWGELPPLSGHAGPVSALQFSADGSRLMAAGAAGASEASEVTVWSADGGTVAARRLTGDDRSLAACLRPDGREVALGRPDGTVLLRRVDGDGGGERVVTPGVRGAVTALAYQPDGRGLAAGSDDGTIVLWDLLAGRPTAELRGHLRAVRALAFSRNGRTVVSGSQDDTARVWDVADAREVQTLLGHRSTVLHLALTADGDRLLTGARERFLAVWSLRAGDSPASGAL